MHTYHYNYVKMDWDCNYDTLCPTHTKLLSLKLWLELDIVVKSYIIANVVPTVINIITVTEIVVPGNFPLFASLRFTNRFLIFAVVNKEAGAFWFVPPE